MILVLHSPWFDTSSSIWEISYSHSSTSHHNGLQTHVGTPLQRWYQSGRFLTSRLWRQNGVVF